MNELYKATMNELENLELTIEVLTTIHEENFTMWCKAKDAESNPKTLASWDERIDHFAFVLKEMKIKAYDMNKKEKEESRQEWLNIMSKYHKAFAAIEKEKEGE